MIDRASAPAGAGWCAMRRRSSNHPDVSGKGRTRADARAHGAGAGASSSTRSGASAHAGFPARMPMGKFLFEYLHRRGVRHSFGVPGDFALPTFAWLDKSPIESITMTHEPGAGFAADAYS